MTKFADAMPVFRAAISLMRETARKAEQQEVTTAQVVGFLDTAADQCENLMDYLEHGT